MSKLHLAAVAASVLFLVACGGGGGGTSTAPTPQPIVAKAEGAYFGSFTSAGGTGVSSIGAYSGLSGGCAISGTLTPRS